eukprot:4399157-Heterocapsa_arctica.AAC.1
MCSARELSSPVNCSPPGAGCSAPAHRPANKNTNGKTLFSSEDLPVHVHLPDADPVAAVGHHAASLP